MLVLAGSALAEPAGTLLFAQPGATIVADSGASRAAVKGDLLQPGERLVTPAGAISQVLLADGSLIGVRPESELRMDRPQAGADGHTSALSLVQGSVRIIAANLMDSRKSSSVALQSGSASVQIRGGDLESALVRRDAKAAPTSAEAGSYQRLLVGSASLTQGATTRSLAPGQVSFVAAGSAGIATLPPSAQNPFDSGRRTAALSEASRRTTERTPLAAPHVLAGGAASRTLKSLPMPVLTPVPVNKPCTRLIGKTCIQ
jgi:hypothetical protein